jgi:hypothetical protein
MMRSNAFDQREEEPVQGRFRGIKLAMNNSLWFVDQNLEFKFKGSYVEVSSTRGKGDKIIIRKI